MENKKENQEHPESILKNEKDAIEVYKLYIARHMKEGDWIWIRFQLYLSLNVGAVAVIGILLKEFLNKLPFEAPIWLWFINGVIFLVGAYLANAWEKVCKDGTRWQFIIDKQIAAIEPAIFNNVEGLYTLIVKEWKENRKHEDVVDTNSRIAKFFFILWSSGFVISVTLFIISFLISVARYFGILT